MGINEMGKEFHRGDIADFVWTYGDKAEKIQNRRNINLNFCNLLIFGSLYLFYLFL